MNKKIPLGIALAFTVFACAVSFAISAGIMERAYNSVLAGLPEKLERYEIIDQDGKIYTVRERNGTY